MKLYDKCLYTCFSFVRTLLFKNEMMESTSLTLDLNHQPIMKDVFLTFRSKNIFFINLIHEIIILVRLSCHQRILMPIAPFILLFSLNRMKIVMQIKFKEFFLKIWPHFGLLRIIESYQMSNWFQINQFLIIYKSLKINLYYDGFF